MLSADSTVVSGAASTWRNPQKSASTDPWYCLPSCMAPRRWLHTVTTCDFKNVSTNGVNWSDYVTNVASVIASGDHQHRAGHAAENAATLGWACLQNGGSSLTKDRPLRWTLHGASEQRSTEEEIQRPSKEIPLNLPHRLSSVVSPCRWPRSLATRISCTNQSPPLRTTAELPLKRRAVEGRTASSQHQPKTRHTPAAAVAECACHVVALSATSEPATDVTNALIFVFEVKPNTEPMDNFFLIIGHYNQKVIYKLFKSPFATITTTLLAWKGRVGSHLFSLAWLERSISYDIIQSFILVRYIPIVNKFEKERKEILLSNFHIW